MTFRTTTRLVEVSVIALDRKGQPVTDLTQDDFHLSAGGDGREIALFRWEGAEQAAAPQVTPAPKGTFSNRVDLVTAETGRSVAQGLLTYRIVVGEKLPSR